jgi:hypothetical protein
VYGRLDGDLLLIAGAGAAIADGGPQLHLSTSLSYLSTAGFYLRYADALGQDEVALDRSIGLGVELRPLFLGRYALNLETGPAHLDLFLDSFMLSAGAFWGSDPKAGFEDEPGLELGVGMEFPILPSGSGPYIGVTGLIRYRSVDFAGTTDADVGERGSMVVFTVTWHQILDAGLVDVGDGLTD